MLFIKEKEKEAFGNNPGIDLVKAGIHKLNIFGNYNLISNLTGGDILKEELVMSLPYVRCLQFMAKKRVESEMSQALIDAKQKTR